MEITTLANVTLADHKGAPHRLGDLWRDHAVVLVFLRHFG